MTPLDNYNTASLNINRLVQEFPQKNGRIGKLSDQIQYFKDTKKQLENNIALLNSYYESGILNRIWKLFDSLFSSPLGDANHLLEEIEQAQRIYEDEYAHLQCRSEQQISESAYIKSYVKSFLAPYFTGKIDAQNEDSYRAPLIEDLFPKFKKQFPQTSLSKEQVKEKALATYIRNSIRHFVSQPGDLNPDLVLRPALSHSLRIDFGDTDCANINEAIAKAKTIQHKNWVEAQRFLAKNQPKILQRIKSFNKGTPLKKESLANSLYVKLKHKHPKTTLHRDLFSIYALNSYIQVSMVGFLHPLEKKLFSITYESLNQELEHFSSHLRKGVELEFPLVDSQARIESALEELRRKAHRLLN